jgi:hypothetical protein
VPRPIEIEERRPFLALALAALMLAPFGCGEPSARELKNRQEFEALLTAVSLKNKSELEKDARRIADRHASGALSDAGHKDLQEIIDQARAGDWAGAEKRAYEFREQHPYFK